MVKHNKLITANGQPQFGVFKDPVREINYQDYDYHSVMDRRATAIEKHFHFNQFQFLGVTNEDIVLGCALVDIKYLGNAFIYLFDRNTQHIDEYSYLQPLGFNTSLSIQPDGGTSHFKKGKNRFQLTASECPRERNLRVNLGKSIKVNITISEPENYQPLAVCTQNGYSGWAYTQKAPALNVTGDIEWKDKHIRLDQNTTLGSYDWSCGYMRRETAWNWASLSGFLENGHRIGFNFASGVNETGYTENGIWVDNRLYKVGQIRFIYDRKDRYGQWKIQSCDGSVDLRFEAEGERSEKLNAVLLASNFTQLFGRFYGDIKLTNGKTITLNGQPGFAEDHYAKW
ncbi:MAG: hypothetical protein CSA49_06145 [Gammaproteobacteria bacterium]|nr:MAG: hypothetical protein CSA49_06145 [Gammaproteobacteria bacterium]